MRLDFNGFRVRAACAVVAGFLIFPCGGTACVWTLTVFALEPPAPLLQATRSCLQSQKDMFLNLTKLVVSVIVSVA